MEHIETFVTASIHTSPKGAKFIRVRFQAGDAEWLTGFNPEGVKDIEWVQRISRTTGKQRIQSKYPICVSFQRSSVVGSDVVATCKLAPRDFTPTEMAEASVADLSVLAGAKGTTVAVASAPTGEADEPIA